MLTAVVILLAGCSVNHKKINAKHHPKNYFDHYETLTALWGMGKNDTLKALDLTASDVTYVRENNNHLGLPWTEVYAGVVLSVILNFNGSQLYRVDNEKTYAYPDELDQAIEDAMKIAAQLEKDLGKPHEVDQWNDWYEEEYKVKIDQKIPSYQDAAQIKAYLEAGLGGGIMNWDMTSIACKEVTDYLEKCNAVGPGQWEHYVTLWIERFDNEIRLGIGY